MLFDIDEKYDLSAYDENANPQEIGECLEQIRVVLEQKSAWIDGICDSSKVKSGESSESVGESSESNSRESNSRESSGKSLSAQTKSEIVAFVEIMKAIHTLIAGDFVGESKWQNDKLLEAQNALNALKSHTSKSSANQN